jgi:hypothetical protein
MDTDQEYLRQSAKENIQNDEEGSDRMLEKSA